MQFIFGCKVLYTTLRDLIVKNYVTCIILVTSWSIAFSTYLFSGRLYIDDINRSIKNYDNWRTGGRPLSDILSRLFFLSSSPFNISPISHIIFFAFIAVSGIIIVRIFGKRESPKNAIYIFPIGISPFIIQIASYTFDSPWYAIGVLTATIAALISTLGLDFIVGIILQVLFIACSLCLYQPTISVFLILSILLIFNRFLQGGEKKKLILQTAASTIGALAVYAVILSTLPLARYAERHKAVFHLKDLFNGFLTNTGKFISILYTDWHNTPIFYIFLTILLLFIVYNFIYVTKHCQKKLAPFLAVIFIIPICFVAIGGVQLMLANPVWQYRVMVAGSILSTVLYFSLPGIHSTIRGKIISFVMVLLCIHSLLFASLYGFVSKMQVQYENYILNHLVYDVDSCLARNDGIKSLDIKGSVRISPALVHLYKIFPVLKRFNPVTFNGRSMWGYVQLKYYSSQVADINFVASNVINLPPPTITTPYYSIYVADNEIIISFPNNETLEQF